MEFSPYAKTPEYDYEEELTKIKVRADWVGPIERVIDELVDRFTWSNLVTPPAISVRSDFAELMEALPEQQREQVLLVALSDREDACGSDHFEQIAAAPTPRVIAAAIAAIEGARARGDDAEMLVDTLVVLGEEDDDIAAVVQAAGLSVD